MIAWALAAQLAVVAHAPPTAGACAPFEITAAASAPGLVPPRLSAPDTSRLELLGSVTTSRVERDGQGRPRAITETAFRVAAPGSQRIRVPGVRATLAGATRQSPPLSLVVAPRGAENADEPEVAVSARLQPEGDDPSAVRYVGAQVTYVVTVRLNAAARHALRHNPIFFPPEMPSALAYDLGALPPARAGTRAHCFERLTYRRALFPLFAGRSVIAPAVLTYALPRSPSSFSAEEAHELRTDSVALVAVEPPAAGRPAGYDGAVGELRATTRVDTSGARMGDPVVLTMRLEGVGNVKLLPRPALALDWATVVTSSERVTVDSTSTVVRGAKEFDWLVTPRAAGRRTIALAPYYFFAPSRATYDSSPVAPLPLDIAAAPLAAADTTAVPRRLAIRAVLRAARGAPLSERPVYWVLLAIAPVPATLRGFARRRRRASVPPSAARRLARAVETVAPLEAHELRALFMRAMDERLGDLPPEAGHGPLAHRLGLAGVTPSTARDADALVAQLDAAAFGGAPLNVRGAATEAARLARAIDADVIRGPAARTTRGRHALGAITLVLATVTAAAEMMPSRASELFARGVDAYRAGDALRAYHQFAAVVARVPRAPDAWANLGTAAWAEADTARAAVAWQRALRLDPLDGDVRRRLAALPAPPSVAAEGYVPPLDVDALARVALAVWMAGWLTLALPHAEPTRGMRPWSAGSIALATALLGIARLGQHQLDVRQRVVFRHTVTMREAPLASTAPAGVGTVGEVARARMRSGFWTRVTVDGARAGWVPTEALRPLDVDVAN